MDEIRSKREKERKRERRNTVRPVKFEQENFWRRGVL
jgi:hypothetical protein